MGFLDLPVFGVGFDILLIVKLFLDDHMHDGVQHRHISPGAELQHMRRVPLQRLTARVHHDQLAAALGELLEEGRRDGVVFGRVRADHNRNIGVFDLVEGRGDRTGSDILHQRGH